MDDDSEQKTPPYLDDYACHTVKVEKDLPQAHSQHEGFSSTPYPLANYVTYTKFSSTHKAFLVSITSEFEPKSFHEAMKLSQWREAMIKEIIALEQNGTWPVVDLPPGKKPIGCKWVYKIKYKSDGSIERYRARLITQDFTQIEGLDFYETFASVAKMASVQCFLVVAMSRNWVLH